MRAAGSAPAGAHAASLACLLLAGCGGGGGGGSQIPAAFLAPPPPVTDGAAFAQGFVSSYDLTAVAAARLDPRFSAQSIRVDYGFTGNPDLSGVVTTQNAYAAIGLEYARSVGLRGTGISVSMIDTPVAAGHAEFLGKSLEIAGLSGDDAFHGTAVASVLGGTDRFGRAMGVAPGASLHVGLIDTSIPVDYRVLAGHMTRAAQRGSVATGDSWTFTGPASAGTDYAATYVSGPGRVYLDALRAYTAQGVVVHAVSNDFAAASVNEVNGLPRAFPELEPGWIAAMSALPVIADGRVVRAERLSSACNEAARYCLAANGTVLAADARAPDAYGIVSGTSFAVPQIAGALALLAEAFPDHTPAQLRDRLLLTADNGFFTPDGTVTFAPGFAHGYSDEFGHGFLGLQAALLPIGPTAMPMPAGAAVPTASPVLVAGGASGDAIMRGLSTRRILVRDMLGGGFTMPALALVGRAEVIDTSRRALARAMRSDQRALRMRRLAGAAGGFGAAGAVPLSLGDPAGIAPRTGLVPVWADGADGFEVAALLPGSDDEAAGLYVSQAMAEGSLNLRVGMAMTSDAGDMLGIAVPGAGSRMRTDAITLHAAMGLDLGPVAALRADLEAGFADGPGAGVIAGFDAVSFTSGQVALDLRDVTGADDVLSVALRAPLAITGGRAHLSLAAAEPDGETRFDSVAVGLAPRRRQHDLAVDYLRPLGRDASLGLSLARIWNENHVAGETDWRGMLVLQRRF